MAQLRYTGEIRVEGELAHVWVFAFDPRWREICKAEFMAEKPGKPDKPFPKAMTSQHAPGRGRWFQARYVDGFPLTSDQRLQMASMASSLEAIGRLSNPVKPGTGPERAYPERYTPSPDAHPASRYLSADEQRMLLKMGRSQRLQWLADHPVIESTP